MICIHYIRCHQPFQDNFPYRSYCLPEHLVLMEIFFSGSQSAPDMSFRLVDIQNLSCLLRQRRIHLHQPLRHVLMYCAFRDAERLRCLPHCGVVVDDIARYPNSSFFNIVFQRKTPQDTFLQCMKVSEGLCPDYVHLFILFIFLRIACQYILSFNTLITVTVVPLTIKKIKYVLHGL